MVPARYGNGAHVDSTTDTVVAGGGLDFNPAGGAVEFWYRPNYDSTSTTPHMLWHNQSANDFFRFEHTASGQLLFQVCTDGSLPLCGGGTLTAATVPGTSFSWRAGSWVHLRTEWNPSTGLRVSVNGALVGTSPPFSVFGLTQGTTTFGSCVVSCPGGGSARHADGILDEPHIYTSDPGTKPLARGGLASSADEFLADPAAGKNFTLFNLSVDGARRGRYLYLGADSKFRGLNVALATPGIGATDLAWEYWNGAQWVGLESGFGFTDETSHLTRDGAIYWTDPVNWSEYSVGGGPDLFYVRVHLASGSYVVAPVEAQIRTDILLFQYLADITTNAQTFSIAAPIGAPLTLSSFANQSFTVGSPPTPMAPLAVVDGSGEIAASNDLRLRIPFGFPMRWDETVTTVTLGGAAAGKVLPTVKGFEDSGRTVVLEVTANFAPGDQLTLSGLQFFSFTAPASAANLELEAGNDGLASAIDDKTIAIQPALLPTLSSDYDQSFVTGAPPVLMVPLTVSEGTSPAITAANDIRVRIPASFNMTWDPGVTSAWILGPAAGKVSAIVSYEDSDQTLVIDVLSPFVTYDFITVSGLYFTGFSLASPFTNLELEVDNAGSVVDLDDKSIRIDLAADVSVFAATATDLQVKLEWVYPAGACNFVRIVRDTAAYPGALDPTLVADVPCGSAGTKDSIVDSPLANGTTYFYSAYVDHGSGYTTGKFLKARPFDTPATIHWAYSTGATSMAPPGLRFQLPESFVYAVSNDGILHSMVGGPGGGDWPAAWVPYRLGGPAQSRPPVVSFSVGGGNGAAFLGSQDGQVYAVDSVTGALKWDEPIGSTVQAAPAGHFQAYNPAAFDLVLVGTRNGAGANSFVGLHVHTGTPQWSFVNSAGQGGSGAALGIISGGAVVDYTNNRAYFASRSHPTGSPDTLWCIQFNGTSVNRLWSQPLGNIDGSPIRMNGRIYVGTNAGIVLAVNATTGAVEWSLPLGDGPIKGLPFPRGTNQLFVSTSTKVWSILDNVTYASVSPGWPVTTIPSPSIPLHIPGTTEVLVGSGDGKLYQMNVVTPLPAKSVVLGDGNAAVGAPSMDLVKMLLYVGTDAGIVYGVTFPLP
jgi:outer membrane protein assembly factor BamB